MPRDDVFFLRDGAEFVATEWTRGPWSPRHQHGGPPAALLAREIERVDTGVVKQVARFTVDFVRPVPMGRLSIATEVIRAGRKTQLVAASLHCEGREVARALALCVRSAHVALPNLATTGKTPQPPDDSKPFRFPFFGPGRGYHEAVEVRMAEPRGPAGEATAWIRMRLPLLAGEAPSPLSRVLVAADSGNGVSMVVKPTEFLFVNADLTVYLDRMPIGEWVCLEAASVLRSSGVGLTSSCLYDERGQVGRSLQALVVDRRLRA